MGTAKRDKSMPKTAGVKSNYCGRTRNAVSDGAFAATRMNAQGCGSITCPATNSEAAQKVIYFFVGYTSFRRAYGDGFLCRQ